MDRLYIKKDISNVFFTSDLHINHKNILGFCSRPFKDTLDMREKLILNWNDTVKDDSLIFVLGDVFFGYTKAKMKEFMDRLKGEKILIWGNHDDPNCFYTEAFTSCHDILHLNLNNEHRFVLSHYPLMTWPGINKGYINAHGHVHLGPHCTGFDKDLPYHKLQYDIGVDNNNYKPISAKDVLKIIQRK